MHLHVAPPLSPRGLLLPRKRLVFGLVALFLALAGAAALFSGQLLLTWDEPIQRSVEANRSGTLDQLFRNVSMLGGTIPVLAVGALGVAVTWRRCPAVALAVGGATLSKFLVETLLKHTIGRSRPQLNPMVDGQGPSFPSGHVMAAVALWGMLPLVVALYTRRRDLWWASVALAGALIAAISASRVYLGVHWFSDIVGGLIVGAFFLMGVETFFHAAHRQRPCAEMVPRPVSAASRR